MTQRGYAPAALWLGTALAHSTFTGGGLPVVMIFEQGNALGYSERTIREAFAQIGANATLDGMWILPSAGVQFFRNWATYRGIPLSDRAACAEFWKSLSAGAASSATPSAPAARRAVQPPTPRQPDQAAAFDAMRERYLANDSMRAQAGLPPLEKEKPSGRTIDAKAIFASRARASGYVR